MRKIRDRFDLRHTWLNRCHLAPEAACLSIPEGDELPRFVKFKSFAPRIAQDGNFASGGVPVAQTGDGHPTDYPRMSTGKILAGH
jgi:hypothetical protein